MPSNNAHVRARKNPPTKPTHFYALVLSQNIFEHIYHGYHGVTDRVAQLEWSSHACYEVAPLFFLGFLNLAA